MLVSVNHLSDLTGLDRRTISRRLAAVAGTVEGGTRKYESGAVLPLLYNGGADGRLDPGQEKAQLDRARRLIIETEHRVRIKKLLDVDEVAREWVGLVTIAKGRLLALPARLAPAVIGLGDLRAIERAIRDAIHEALTELSTEFAKDEPSNGAE